MGSGPASEAAAEAAEEAEWIERARRGDTAAFRRLVLRHKDRAFGLAYRILGSAADAEEVAQDAFVRVWRALPEFRGESRFGTWLHRIVLRRAFDAAGRLRRRSSREESLEARLENRGLDAAVSCVPAAGAMAWPAEDDPGPRLRRLLADLTEVQRAVVTLYYYEDCSIQEVSRVLELPANTVKTHLHRARAALREAMARGEAGVR